jgi:Xaa-Pro aminopeptidase
MKNTLLTGFFLILFFSNTLSFAQNKSWEKIPAMPKLLSQREQLKVRSEWLKKRLDTMLLPMMKKHNVDMWIVVNEEFHSDPVTPSIVPPIPIVGRRDFFVFINNGDKLDRVAVIRYQEEQLAKFYTMMNPPSNQIAATLKKLIEERDPKTIALNYKGTRGASGGLTSDAYKFLADAVGDKYEKRFVSAQPLIIDYLDTRIPEELKHYRTAVLATDVITRRAFSNEVITPGKTTVGDVRWWMMQQINNLGLDTWFQADLRVQRRTKDNKNTQSFLETASEATVLERGDVIHVDFGLNYMGLSTDWQKHGYILNKGEKDAPAGLKAALKNTNRLQDILFSHARVGMTGAEAYDKTMADCQKEGIRAMIYSHPIGNQGHGLGPSIDFRRGTIGGDVERFRLGSYTSIELNTSTAVPEWGGQGVTIMGEDDAYMTEKGYQFFRPRQTEFYLIK